MLIRTRASGKRFSLRSSLIFFFEYSDGIRRFDRQGFQPRSHAFHVLRIGKDRTVFDAHGLKHAFGLDHAGAEAVQDLIGHFDEFTVEENDIGSHDKQPAAAKGRCSGIA